MNCASCTGTTLEHQVCCPALVREVATLNGNRRTQALVQSLQLRQGRPVMTAEQECRQLAVEYRGKARTQPGLDYDELARHWWLVAEELARRNMERPVACHSMEELAILLIGVRHAYLP